MSAHARVFLLIGLGISVGVLANVTSSKGISLANGASFVAVGSETSCVAPPAQAQISTADAQALHKSEAALFIDVRSPADFAEGHIAEAKHVACNSELPEWLSKIPRDRAIVLYGSDANDVASAERISHALQARGYSNVRVLTNGFASWKQGNGPAESGTCESCN